MSNRIDSDAFRRLGLRLTAAAVLGALLTASAYWPGLMTWDPVRQYGEALSGQIDDWHPPAMQWLWRQLLAVHSGPAPMLIMQLALYWGGLAILARSVAARYRPRIGWAILACGLLPLGLALTGMILKDCLMAGALLVATGLLARRQNGAGPYALAGALAMLIMAATLRFNGFAACLPLLVALLPRAWWRSWPRLAVTTIVATAALMAVMPVANRMIGASPSGVELSLVIFDLGGITEHSGIDVFPGDIAVSDAVSVNHGCYHPDKWDSYSDWHDPECPLGFTAWNDNVDSEITRPYPFWLRAGLAHPIAYAQHRLTHFAINTRILPLSASVERPVPATGAPNPWGFHLEPNAITRTLDGLAMGIARTPLGWPIVWIGLALSALIASRGLDSARLIAPIALSASLYGAGYLVFSVASELRYHLWTEVAALIAMVLTLADPGARARLTGWAAAPTLLALLAGIIGRLVTG